MTLVAMGLGTRKAPAGANLDPTESFWSFLSMVPKLSGKNQSGIISGLKLAPSSKKTMAVTVGGDPSETDAGVIKIGRRFVLVSNTGDPATIALPAADTAGAFNVAIALYIDSSNPDSDKETAGTPQYVKTLVVKGTVGETDLFSDESTAREKIETALPAGAGGAYLYLGWVEIAANASSLSGDGCHPVDSCISSVSDIREKLQKEVDQLKSDAAQTAREAYQKVEDMQNNIGKYCRVEAPAQDFYLSPGSDIDHPIVRWNVKDGDQDLIVLPGDSSFKICNPGTYIIQASIAYSRDDGDYIKWDEASWHITINGERRKIPMTQSGASITIIEQIKESESHEYTVSVCLDKASGTCLMDHGYVSIVKII